MLEHLDIRNLADTNYPFLRRLIELMPVETLYNARRVNAEINHFSNRRTEIVESLRVERDNGLDAGYITYSDMVNRPRQLTPLYHLSVHMSPNIIDPSALVAKMERKRYNTLHIYGEYNWRQLTDFFHPNLKCVKLFGEMPTNEVMDFFRYLLEYPIPKVIMLNVDCNFGWVDRAYTVWKLSQYVSFRMYHHMYYYRLDLIGTDNVRRQLKLLTWGRPDGEPADYEKWDEEDSDDEVFGDDEDEQYIDYY